MTYPDYSRVEADGAWRGMTGASFSKRRAKHGVAIHEGFQLHENFAKWVDATVDRALEENQ